MPNGWLTDKVTNVLLWCGNSCGKLLPFAPGFEAAGSATDCFSVLYNLCDYGDIG